MKKFFKKHKQKLAAAVAVLIALVMIFGSLAMFFI
jgi:hypothetical protein